MRRSIPRWGSLSPQGNCLWTCTPRWDGPDSTLPAWSVLFAWCCRYSNSESILFGSKNPKYGGDRHMAYAFSPFGTSIWLVSSRLQARKVGRDRSWNQCPMTQYRALRVGPLEFSSQSTRSWREPPGKWASTFCCFFQSKKSSLRDYWKELFSFGSRTQRGLSQQIDPTLSNRLRSSMTSGRGRVHTTLRQFAYCNSDIFIFCLWLSNGKVLCPLKLVQMPLCDGEAKIEWRKIEVSAWLPVWF